MSGAPVEEFVIPARYGRAFTVDKGQVFRIHQIDGGQVGDCVFYNAHDHKEMFHVGQTWAYNVILGTGTAKRYSHFYSKPPREQVMMTVLEDSYGNHFGASGGRCSARLYRLRDDIPSGHRSCQENLAEALAPHGLTGDDVFDIFKVFMNVDLFEDGRFEIKPTGASAEDYIEMRAEMDLLVAVSACPSELSPANHGRCKPLGIKVFAG